MLAALLRSNSSEVRRFSSCRKFFAPCLRRPSVWCTRPFPHRHIRADDLTSCSHGQPAEFAWNILAQSDGGHEPGSLRLTGPPFQVPLGSRSFVIQSVRPRGGIASELSTDREGFESVVVRSGEHRLLVLVTRRCIRILPKSYGSEVVNAHCSLISPVCRNQLKLQAPIPRPFHLRLGFSSLTRLIFKNEPGLFAKPHSIGGGEMLAPRYP